MHRAALVRLDFAGRDEELHLIWISGCFHIRQSFGPGGGTHQPHEGEHHCHYKVLTARKREETGYGTIKLKGKIIQCE